MAVLNGPSPKQFELISMGNTEEDFQDNLEKLKRWAEDHPYISTTNYEYLYPLFLRGCKYNLFRAQDKLNEFFIARSTCDALYANWDFGDSGTQAAIKFMECVPLPQLTDDGYRVVIHRILENDEASLRDTARFLLMLGDLRMKQEHPIVGDIYVFDVKHLRASFLVKLVNPLLKKVFGIAQHAYPQRLKQIHVINAPSFISNFVGLIKSIMKKKMRDRFVIHTSQDTLADYISKTILPSDYQGDEDSLSEMNKQWVDSLANSMDELIHVNFIVENNGLQSNYKSISKEDLYGADGLFKTLEID